MGFFKRLVGAENQADTQNSAQQNRDARQKQELKRRLALVQIELDVLRRESK